MKWTLASILVVLVLASALGSTTLLGPYHFTLPVTGLGSGDLAKVREVFDKRFGHDMLELSLKDGLLECYVGGEGPRSLLSLNDVLSAVEEAGGRGDPSGWMLKPQQVGVCLSTREALSAQEIEESIESLTSVGAEVLGTILVGDRMCVVLELEKATDYAAFQTELQKKSLEIEDLIWGHWKYGWKIESEHSDHGHEMGILPKVKSKGSR